MRSGKNCGYVQKMNETGIINLMAAWLFAGGGGVFVLRKPEFPKHGSL